MKILLTLLVTSYLLITGAIVAGTMRNDSPQNPFAEFFAYLPGNPRPTNWQCYEDEYTMMVHNAFYCSHNPDHPLIRFVSVSGQNDIIDYLSFGTRLRLGDLVAVFGGDWISRRRERSFTLTNNNIIAYARRRSFGMRSLFLNVYHVWIGT